jgi:DNA-binding IclR family transcriptional regulator
VTGLPLSTAHRLVRELAAWKILERTHEGDYCVGLPLRLIGGAGGTTTSL